MTRSRWAILPAWVPGSSSARLPMRTYSASIGCWSSLTPRGFASHRSPARRSRSSPSNRRERRVLLSRARIACIDLANVSPDPPVGRVSAAAGEAAYRYITHTAALAIDSHVDAIRTAPVNKTASRAAGYNYPGQTELLVDLTGATRHATMLNAPELKVIHVTTHVGLSDAIAVITPNLCEPRSTWATTRCAATSRPRPSPPTLARTVCSVREKRPRGPRRRFETTDGTGSTSRVHCRQIPALFRARRGDFDLVVAMYHDQGHGPIKVLGLDDCRNVTVGLPIVRTSVDHRTAFDIAGKGVASPGSLTAALHEAAALATARAAGRARSA